MVTTRSAGASEPLEMLHTPPKRQRKTKQKKPESQGPVLRTSRTSWSPIVAQSPLAGHQATPMREANQNKHTEPSPPTTLTSKRKRSEDESESQDENASPKRRRNMFGDSPAMDPFFMFPKKDLSDDEEELARADPPKSYAEMIRRERRLRQLKKKNIALGISPRRSLVSMNGRNPFGINAWSPQESGNGQDTSTPLEHHERDERSAAPEPETPKPSTFFGSLRTLGSATIGRAQSLLGSLTPRSGTNTPKAETIPNPRMPATESRATRRSKPVWEIEYPKLPETPANTEEELTESEKKRRAYEAEHGMTNRDYDHLHTESIDGNPDSLPYPIKQRNSTPIRDDGSSFCRAAAIRQERREKHMEELGLGPNRKLPKIAPLFGPNSHSARKTVDPRMKEFKETGIHPADREFAEDTRKRKAMAEEAESEGRVPTFKQLPSASRTFQAFVEDEPETSLSTPAAKRQKTTQEPPQTPRSVMKVPGSVSRTSKSVTFNRNPVSKVKRMTPPANTSPAGTYNPHSLFKTFADDERDRRQGIVQDSPASDISTDPSPNTRANTLFNAQVHPGDALTNAINDANPKKIDYVWRDPANPEWRPSLANPQPGTFRFVPEEDEDEEMDMLAEIEREETAKAVTQTSATPEAEAPQPPSTPRMSHAELPKLSGSAQNPTTPTATTPSASALEAANLERRRAEAAKTRPKTSSRLAEVTSARSRSPSPPGLDTDNLEGASPTESAAKTPSPVLEQGTWTWTDETNEYIPSNPHHPSFAFNRWGELIPSACLRDSDGEYDDNLVGPDGFTEMTRQAHYRKIYDEEWAKKAFPFDKPMTYEEAGCGTKLIHDLIRKNDALYPDLVAKAGQRFAEEWDAHAKAIEDAQKQGKRLVAIYPDRDGLEMLDADDME